MKKALIIYASILIGVFVLFSVLDLKGDYTVERRMWGLFQQQLDIAKDPTVIPERAFEDITNEYKKIIAEYPDSTLTPGIHLQLGEIYTLKKDFVSARKVLNEIIGLYPDNRELSAEAMFKIGKTYEFEENWVKASKTYNKIILKYSETDTAMGVPIYIANYYKGQNDFQGTMDAYEVAIRYYKKMASDHDGTKVGLNALRFLSNCYLEQNRWIEAIDTLGAVIEKYASSGYLTDENADMTVKTINVVSAYQLQDYDIAIGLYRGIIDRNPGHRFRGYLEKMIGAFDQLREKGIDAPDLK
ncbi:MAG: tetratricopeptide repeat protein [Candidatus Omnitrophica bacterium]|nr:tetratricopeptide repeat protein [Candidatus Omnitrophota bacterium]